MNHWLRGRRASGKTLIVPGTLLGTEDIAMDEINMVPGFMEIAPNYFTIDMNISPG